MNCGDALDLWRLHQRVHVQWINPQRFASPLAKTNQQKIVNATRRNQINDQNSDDFALLKKAEDLALSRL